MPEKFTTCEGLFGHNDVINRLKIDVPKFRPSKHFTFEALYSFNMGDNLAIVAKHTSVTGNNRLTVIIFDINRHVVFSQSSLSAYFYSPWACIKDGIKSYKSLSGIINDPERDKSLFSKYFKQGYSLWKN
jgi:hypothetical protein